MLAIPVIAKILTLKLFSHYTILAFLRALNIILRKNAYLEIKYFDSIVA